MKTVFLYESIKYKIMIIIDIYLLDWVCILNYLFFHLNEK